MVDEFPNESAANAFWILCMTDATAWFLPAHRSCDRNAIETSYPEREASEQSEQEEVVAQVTRWREAAVLLRKEHALGCRVDEGRDEFLSRLGSCSSLSGLRSDRSVDVFQLHRAACFVPRAVDLFSGCPEFGRDGAR